MSLKVKVTKPSGPKSALHGRKDGKGFNLQLTCLPVNGRLVIREIKVDEQEGSGQ